jgi:hypothetical protein
MNLERKLENIDVVLHVKLYEPIQISARPSRLPFIHNNEGVATRFLLTMTKSRDWNRICVELWSTKALTDKYRLK